MPFVMVILSNFKAQDLSTLPQAVVVNKIVIGKIKLHIFLNNFIKKPPRNFKTINIIQFKVIFVQP